MVTPHGKCKVIVNGVPITTKTKLRHLVNSPVEPEASLSLTDPEGPRMRVARLGAMPHCPPAMGHCNEKVTAVESRDQILNRCAFWRSHFTFLDLNDKAERGKLGER